MNVDLSRPERAAAAERWAMTLIVVVSVLVIGAVAVLLLSPRARPAGALDVSALPALNATLNGMSAALLATGYVFIRRRRIVAHLACMVSAFGISTLFLISYVVYHYYAGSRPFTGQGWIRPVYFTLLLTHIVLAAAIVPLALATIWRALSGLGGARLSGLRGEASRLDRHVRIARWTLPIWLYVSVTGVLIYWLLYH